MRSILLSLSCIALLAGCGHASNDAASAASTAATAPVSTPSPAMSIGATIDHLEETADVTTDVTTDTDRPQTAMQLTALSKDDIALYLQVMYAAADRVQHPTAADKATLARYKTLMAAANTNKAMVPSAADAITMADATMLELQMDMVIVRERHIDEKRYEGISSIIDDVVPNPTMGAAGGAAGEGAPTDLPRQSGASIDLQQKIHAAEMQDTAILAPYRTEIQQLLSVVRDMRRVQ